MFVNGLRFRGSRVDATGQPGPNEGRLGFFSDLYYDPVREEWWALSDRGPGGGVLDYQTRVQKISLDVNPLTGQISTSGSRRRSSSPTRYGLLSTSRMAAVTRRRALNGLNPFLLNDDASELGRSFDPEGLVIDPGPATSSWPTSTVRRCTSSTARVGSSSSSRRPANLIPR